MNHRKLFVSALTALALALALPGCGGGEGCEDFANHLADIATKEASNPVDDQMRAKMVKKTLDSCSASPPNKEALDCAMKAQTIAAMKACEGGGEEDDKAEAGKADGEADGKADGDGKQDAAG